MDGVGHREHFLGGYIGTPISSFLSLFPGSHKVGGFVLPYTPCHEFLSHLQPDDKGVK